MRQPRVGRRLELKSRDQIDAVVALAIAVEAAENKPAQAELLGWV